MLDRMKQSLEDARSNLQAAQQKAARQANKSRRDEEFNEGDEVVLSTKNLRTFDMHLPVKLRRRWTGPFKILKKISPMTYRLELPPGWRIHPTFHISNLRRFNRSDTFVREEQPPPPVLVGDYLEYEVEGRHVLGSKFA